MFSVCCSVHGGGGGGGYPWTLDRTEGTPPPLPPQTGQRQDRGYPGTRFPQTRHFCNIFSRERDALCKIIWRKKGSHHSPKRTSVVHVNKSVGCIVVGSGVVVCYGGTLLCVLQETQILMMCYFRFSDIYKVDLVNDSLYEWNVRLMK